MRTLALLLTASLLTSYEPLIHLAKTGAKGIFDYLAHDAFYYLTVARNCGASRFFTFDQIFPTNGFHPLWQVYLSWLFTAAGAFDDASLQLWLTMTSCIVFVAVGTALFVASLRQITGRSWIALVAVLPGFFYLAFGHAGPGEWSPWGFANGMETPLTVLWFGVLTFFLFCHRGLALRSVAGSLMLAVILTLGALSRLDDIFLFLPFIALLALQSEDHATRFRLTAVLMGVPIVVFSCYLLYNLHYAGSAFPISGSAKAGWSLKFNVLSILGVLIPHEQFASYLPPTEWAHKALRSTQLIVPILVCSAWLAGTALRVGRRGIRQLITTLADDAAIGALCVYVIIKGAYNIAFVNLWHQGSWYFPLSVMTANLVVGRYLADVFRTGIRADSLPDRPRLGASYVAAAVVVVSLLALGFGLAQKSQTPIILGRYSSFLAALNLLAILIAAGATYVAVEEGRGKRRIAMRALGIAAALALVLFQANLSAEGRRAANRGERYFEFWRNRQTIESELGRRYRGRGVLEFEDGFLAYCFRQPVLNGIGLSVDRVALDAKRRGRLLDLAYERGFRVFASLSYLSLSTNEARDPAAVVSSLRRANYILGSEDLARWSFRVIYQEPFTNVAFIAFEPRRDDGRVARLSD